jgi:hypothetical protein
MFLGLVALPYISFRRQSGAFLSHQCGFASCDGGNELSDGEQWAKIDQGQKIACDIGVNESAQLPTLNLYISASYFPP